MKHKAAWSSQQWGGLLVMMGMLFLTSCKHNSPLVEGVPETGGKASAKVKPIRYADAEFLVICDISESESQEKRRQVTDFLNPIIRQCEGQARFTICTFASKVREIDTFMPSDPREVWELLDDNIIKVKGEQGTYWTPVLHKIESCTIGAHQRGKLLVAIVLTNGGFNDIKTLEPSVANLLQLKELHTLVIGPLTYEKCDHIESDSCYETVKGTLSGLGDQLIAFPETTGGMERAFAQLRGRLK